LLTRKQLLERLFRAQEMRPPPVAMVGNGNGAGNAQAGGEARERFARAMMDIHFDSERWLAQFQSGDPVLTKVVLAAAPSTATVGAQGVERLRELVLDPVYQLK
jgi:hypothetical protein